MVPAAEWAFWMDETQDHHGARKSKVQLGEFERVFGSIANKVTSFEPGKEVAPGITSIAAYGHTPGHSAFAIASGNQSMMTVVDATNNAYLFVRNPEWQAAFDTDGPTGSGDPQAHPRPRRRRQNAGLRVSLAIPGCRLHQQGRLGLPA